MSPVETSSEPATIAAALGPPPLRMSYDEWLKWEYQDSLTEWVDGEVLIYMPPFHEHQQVIEFLDRLLGLFVQIFQLGLIRIAPFTMRILPEGPAREPDLFFLAAEHRERLTQKALLGPADLVIEVVSDDSVARDRTDKFYEYQEGGVREYWIIDPRAGKQRVDLYVLDTHGRYQPVPPTPEAVYHSSVLSGFWLHEEWLWAEEPNPLAALAAIAGPERVIAALRQTAE